MINIMEEIGEAAVLEQLAEECTELAKAALKLARILREGFTCGVDCITYGKGCVGNCEHVEMMEVSRMRLIDADALLDRLDELFKRRELNAACTGNRGSFVTWNDAICAIKDAPTVQSEVQLSPIEQALHGLSPEAQAGFLINLMRGTLAYIDSRAALIKWLERGYWNGKS